MFAKVFTQIFDSSIAEDYRVRLVFEDFLKLADKDGIVDMTRESISRRTNVPLEIVTMGIDALERPDTTSRTPELNGRRLKRLDEHRDWGWKIVNFRKYRESADREMLRMSESARKQEYRRRKQGFPPTPPIPSTDTEGEGEAEQSRSRPGLSGTCPGRDFPEVEIPSWEEVQAECQKIGLVEWRARDWFDEMETSGWKDGKKREVMKWKPYLRRVKGWWDSDGRPMTRPVTKTGYTRYEPETLAEKEMKAMEKQIKKLQ